MLTTLEPQILNNRVDLSIEAVAVAEGEAQGAVAKCCDRQTP